MRSSSGSKRQIKAHIRYHAHEKCIYLNPADTHKATTVEELCGENFVAFGNDQNDIELFEKALYAIQIGDFPSLRPYADDQISGQTKSTTSCCC